MPDNENQTPEATREQREDQPDACPMPETVAKAMEEKTSLLFCIRCGRPRQDGEVCPYCGVRQCPTCND